MRAGHPGLDAARLPFGRSVFRSVRVGEDGQETPVSVTEQEIRHVDLAGVPAVRVDARHVSAAGDTTISTIWARARDLAFLAYRVRAARDSAAAAWAGGRLSGWTVLPDAPARLVDRALPAATLPLDGPAAWLVAALPLAPGYRAVVERLNPWLDEPAWLEVVVAGVDTLALGEHSHPCWRVEGERLGPPGYRATRWVDRRGRVLRSELAHPDGGARWHTTLTEFR